MSKIEKALKRIGHGEIKVILREGVITKIPRQKIEGRVIDGIREEKHVDEEIVE